MKLLLISFLKVITISKTYTALVETILFDLIVGFPNSSVGKESPCIAGDPGSIPGLGRSPGEGIGYPLQIGFPCGSAGKESACNAGDLGSIPGFKPWVR